MTSTLDLASLQTWIGREETLHDMVTPELVGRFYATFDVDAAAPAPGDIAPRLIHYCLAQSADRMSELGADGHPERGGFLPPIPLPRRMWASGVLSFPDEIRVGERVVRRSRVADIQVKSGRTGELCFVTVEHRIESADRLAVEERQILVYREAPGSNAPAAVNSPVQAVDERPKATIEVTPPLLFRYSALTFNSHRIHYDRRYTVEVERYPGLVVHGPLQATLLMNLAIDLRRGMRPSRVEFRAGSPLFDDAPVQLFAEERADGSLRLWTARPGGPEAMVAEAHWGEGR